MADRYLSVEELAHFTGMSKSNIYNRVHRKQIPYLKFGGKVAFDPEQIKNWGITHGYSGQETASI